MRRATIEAGPDDDTCALAWADALQEAGDEARAEFVKSQVELETLGVSREEGRALGTALQAAARVGHRRAELRNRESALLAAHEHEWRRAGACPECGGKGGEYRYTDPLNRGLEGDNWYSCHACFGTGDMGGLLRKYGGWTPAHGGERFTSPVRWRRGLPDAVECRLEDVLERPLYNARLDTEAYGPLRPTVWARAVATHHPSVTRFVLTDRDCGGAAKSFLRDDELREPYSLPAVLFEAVYALRKHNQRDGRGLYFDARESAIDALAVAACGVVWGKPKDESAPAQTVPRLTSEHVRRVRPAGDALRRVRGHWQERTSRHCSQARRNRTRR
jgi:uncharacterized protein (TIGR02996 family)